MSSSFAVLYPSLCRSNNRLRIGDLCGHFSGARSHSFQFLNQQAQGLQTREYEHTDNPFRHSYRYQLINPALQWNLRRSLDNLAQDLLDLSEYLSKLQIKRQTLLNRKSGLGQEFGRASDGDQRRRLADDFTRVSESIQDIDAKLFDARRHQLPNTESRFFVRLKRLHRRLPESKANRVIAPSNRMHKAIIRGNMRLSVLLSLPVTSALDELAHHLLTSSSPFTEESFFIMIKKLTLLRYASMARAAYHHLIAAGYIPPEKPKEITPLLKLSNAIADKKGFHRLLRSMKRSGVTIDKDIYGSLIIGFLKLGKPAQAMEQFHAMLSEGIQPQLSVLTHLLHDCGSRRNWNMGKEIWRMIKIQQLRGNLTPDKWAYYEMWRLSQRCAKYFIARHIRQEAFEHGMDLGNIVKRLRHRPVRRSNKSPELLHYYDSFHHRNLEIALSFARQVRGHRPPKSELVISSSKLAREEVQRLVEHRQQRLRNSPKFLDAIDNDSPPEPFKAPNGERNVPSDRHHAHRDEETADLIEEASRDFIRSVETSDRLSRHYLHKVRIAKSARSSKKPVATPVCHNLAEARMADRRRLVKRSFPFQAKLAANSIT